MVWGTDGGSEGIFGRENWTNRGKSGILMGNLYDFENFDGFSKEKRDELTEIRKYFLEKTENSGFFDF